MPQLSNQRPSADSYATAKKFCPSAFCREILLRYTRPLYRVESLLINSFELMQTCHGNIVFRDIDFKTFVNNNKTIINNDKYINTDDSNNVNTNNVNNNNNNIDNNINENYKNNEEDKDKNIIIPFKENIDIIKNKFKEIESNFKNNI